jgi:hypothetical protein
MLGRPLLLPALAALLGCLWWSSSFAGSPDPGMSTVPNVRYDPGGLYTYVVTVRDVLGAPVSGAAVSIVFSAAADAAVCWCSTQAHPIINAVADTDGRATFEIHAGGCVDPAHFPVPAIEVFANAVKLAEVGGVSSDAVDAAGLFPWQGWNNGGTCVCGLADAVDHNAFIRFRDYSFCTDIDSDGKVGLLDAVFLTAPIKSSAICSE